MVLSGIQTLILTKKPKLTPSREAREEKYKRTSQSSANPPPDLNLKPEKHWTLILTPKSLRTGCKPALFQRKSASHQEFATLQATIRG